MRISFFNPSPPHFNNPCPRCGNILTQQIRNKYEYSAGSKAKYDFSHIELIYRPNAPDPYRLASAHGGYNQDFEPHPNPEAKEPVGEWPQKTEETIVPAPLPLCRCCEFFRGNPTCAWCDNCPTDYCKHFKTTQKGH